jgi:hypothetical protein
MLKVVWEDWFGLMLLGQKAWTAAKKYKITNKALVNFRAMLVEMQW